MPQHAGGHRRSVGAAVLAFLLLLIVVAATGSRLPFGGGSNSSPTSPPAPAQETFQTVTPTTPGKVAGQVTVQVDHRQGTVWHFLYTVRNTGPLPIAGFQINGATSNLFGIQAPSGWASFGSGVCGGRPPGVLIYWSTTSSSPTRIPPGSATQFSFSVNTTRPVSVSYSLSYGAATPVFGRVMAPAGSTLPAGRACKG